MSWGRAVSIEGSAPLALLIAVVFAEQGRH
jgi:hypothetical protein